MKFIYTMLSTEESYVSQIMEQLNLSPWDWVACIAGVLSLFVAIMTAYFQFQTEGNTQKMSQGVQVSRLKGFYRHMYRNMVKIRAMQILVEREYENKKYRVPSAEHLLKLKLAEDDICEEAFYANSVVFEKLKELKLQVRNVNIEVDVADRYLSSKNASRDARKEILETLLMKQGDIAEEIRKILTVQFEEKGVCEHVKEVIVNSHKKNMDNNKDEKKHGKLTNRESYNEKECKMYKLFNEAHHDEGDDDFFTIFNKDVKIELGLNDSDRPKIAMI